jgi:hypothetical protein
MEAVQRLALERTSRSCPDFNCAFIKAAVIEMMIPYIGPLAQVVEDKARRHAIDEGMSVDNFVSEIVYEVMVTMGKFAGTSVQTTMEVCNACTQAAAIEKGERH